MEFNEVPLIWTAKGNVPVESLEYIAKWEDTPEYIKFVETYTLDGEVVKQNAHVYGKKPLLSDAVAQQLI